MKLRRLDSRALEKVWGTPATEPWYPHTDGKVGEVWFHAPEEPRLLVKFLFTSESLSVQVHPPDTSGQVGKTEMWHVLRSEPGAVLALGFVHPVTRGELRDAALTGKIVDLLRWFAPGPGDTFFVPAGTVHAIGAGLALCEIQQYSDVTYRLYDYGRARELHLDQGLAVADLGCHAGPEQAKDLGDGRRLLVECPYFRTESLHLTGGLEYPPVRQSELLICLEGTGRFDGKEYAPGQVWAVPAGLPSFAIHPDVSTRLLRTHATC